MAAAVLASSPRRLADDANLPRNGVSGNLGAVQDVRYRCVRLTVSPRRLVRPQVGLPARAPP